MDGLDPETPVSDEERVIDCGAMGVVHWEVAQSLWDFLEQLPEADRQRILDIIVEKLHEQCHGILAYVARYVGERVENSPGLSPEDATCGDTFPEDWAR